MTEFTSNKNLSLRRLEFQKAEHTVAIITERFVWYRRYRIKGARHIVFYGPPSERAVFPEILGAVQRPSSCTCTCFYTKADMFALERVVGLQRAKKLLAAPPQKLTVIQ